MDEKSDVYSFGVVLLELLTGLRPVGEHLGEDGVDLVQWARARAGTGGGVLGLLDPRLVGDVPVAEAAQLLFVAMLCVQENSVERPTMREVVQMLSELPPQASPSTTSSASSLKPPAPAGEESSGGGSSSPGGKDGPAVTCGYKLFVPDLLA